MIRKGYVDTSSGQIHFRTAGVRGGATPLVLLHQTASSSVMFEALMDRLASRYFIFAPDTPGFGGSDPLPERATMPLYGRAIAEACRRTEITSCFLFGHHTGASIAVQMEHDCPGFARKLALSGPPYLTAEQKAALAVRTEPIVLDADGAYVQRLWKRLRAKDESAPLALVHREMVLNLTAGVRYHEAYDAVFTDDLERKLARVACPTLVMAGESDTLYASLEPAFRALARGEMARIPAATTYVLDREPDAVAEILTRFFSS